MRERSANSRVPSCACRAVLLTLAYMWPRFLAWSRSMKHPREVDLAAQRPASALSHLLYNASRASPGRARLLVPKTEGAYTHFQIGLLAPATPRTNFSHCSESGNSGFSRNMYRPACRNTWQSTERRHFSLRQKLLGCVHLSVAFRPHCRQPQTGF